MPGSPHKAWYPPNRAPAQPMPCWRCCPGRFNPRKNHALSPEPRYGLPEQALMAGKIWFVGAGPGDPDLITVKGRKLLEASGAVLFAGSLVDQAATLFAPEGCEIRDSKDMTLE